MTTNNAKKPVKNPVKGNQHVVVVPQRLLEERQAESSHIIGALLTAASDPKNDVDKMERLWIMHKEALAMRAEQEYAIAKNALAMEIPPIPKNHVIEFLDKKNKLQRTPYADRGDIEKVLDPICQKHGFSREYTTEVVDGKIQTVLIVRHVGGHKEYYRSPPMPLDTTGSKNNNQAAGSTSEYGKRYALIGAFNIIGVDRDDDGNLGESPEDAGKDKFAEKVKEQSSVQDVKPKITVEQLAKMLEAKLRNEPSKLRRGEILMANVNILADMEEKGLNDMACAIRDLAEEAPSE